MSIEQKENRGVAPADARAHRPWPLWAKVLVYAIMLAVAVVSVWFINRRVDALAQ